MTKAANGYLKEIFAKVGIQVAIYAVGLVFAGFNAYATMQLAPLVARIDKLDIKVAALEKTSENTTQRDIDIAVIKSNVELMRADIKEIRRELLNDN